MSLFFTSYNKYQSTLIYFLPFALVTGPFLPDLIVSISAISFIFYCVLKKNFQYFKNVYFYLFCLWCLYLLINSLFSDSIYNSLESSLFYIRFGVFSCCLFYLIIEYDKFLLYFTYSLIFTFIFVIFDAYFQYFSGYNILGFPYNGTRLSGLTGENLVLGSYISRLFPLLFGLSIFFFKSKKSLLLIFFFLIITDIIIFLSGERTAFFNLFLFTFLLLLLTVKRRVYRLISITISIIVIIMISNIDISTKERMIDLTVKEIGGQNNITQEPIEQVDMLNLFGKKFYLFTKYHTAHYYTAADIFLDNKLFGVGTKNYRIVCADEKYVSRFGCNTHPHNSYMQLLSETGIIGTLPIFLLFISLTIIFLDYMTVNKIRIFDKNNEYLTCLFICLYISIWPLIPSGNFFNNWLSVIYFLPIGFILAELKKRI